MVPSRCPLCRGERTHEEEPNPSRHRRKVDSALMRLDSAEDSPPGAYIKLKARRRGIVQPRRVPTGDPISRHQVIYERRRYTEKMRRASRRNDGGSIIPPPRPWRITIFRSRAYRAVFEFSLPTSLDTKASNVRARMSGVILERCVSG